MSPDERRVKTLRRVRRLREIEAMSVQRDLAEARGQEQRMHELFLKTQLMAGEYSQRENVTTPAELAQSMGLANSLVTLGAQARSNAKDAAEQAQTAAQELNRLEHQQTRLGERIGEIERAVRDEAEKRENSTAARRSASKLARPLQT